MGAFNNIQAASVPAIQPMGANPPPANAPSQAQIDLTPMVNDDSTDPVHTQNPSNEGATQSEEPEATKPKSNMYTDLCNDTTLAMWEDITLTDAGFTVNQPNAPTSQTRGHSTTIILPTTIAQQDSEVTLTT